MPTPTPAPNATPTRRAVRLRGCWQRPMLRIIFDPVAGGRMVEGAAAELRCATLGDTAPGNMMPLDVFLPTPAELQYRVDAATTYGTPVQDNASGIAAQAVSRRRLGLLGRYAPDRPVWNHELYPAW